MMSIDQWENVYSFTKRQILFHSFPTKWEKCDAKASSKPLSDVAQKPSSRREWIHDEQYSSNNKPTEECFHFQLIKTIIFDCPLGLWLLFYQFNVGFRYLTVLEKPRFVISTTFVRDFLVHSQHSDILSTSPYSTVKHELVTDIHHP